MRRTLAVAIILAGATACSDIPEPTAPSGAPLLSQQSGSEIPGQYIVVFNNGVADAPGLARSLTNAHGGRLGHVYSAALSGFSVENLPLQAVQALSRNPNVAWVEQDEVVTLSATQSPATWGIDRIDQRNLPLSNSYTYNATGAGVRAYIIDTGVRLSHNDFGGRASFGFDALGGTGDDCNGHGTHVAGTTGGTTYGVAKGVSIVAVRVLNCQGSGTWSGIIAGIDWVTANHVKPAVANMSLGGGANSSVDTAVRNSIAAGVSYAIAAGNSSANACNYSPARVGEAMTIGSSTSSDARSSFSNYGNCVDFFAPGSSITSAWRTSNTAINTISGTSMAAPHVAGAAALYLEGSPNASPATVRQALYDATTKGKITGSNSTNNHLLYTLFGTSEPPPPPPPPPSGFTLAATGYKVKGVQRADLTWTGASTGVDVYRNNVRVVTNTANDGAHTDNIGGKGGGSYVYRVCNTGTTTCSNNATVSF